MILRSMPASFGEGAGVPLSAAIGKVKGKRGKTDFKDML